MRDDNDRAEVKDIRGLGAENLPDGLIEMQREAERFTKARNGMYHITINPTSDERLTEAQWERCFEIFEEGRGIPPGQPRIVVEHEKNGRVHRHAIYARFDPENMRVWEDGHDAPICHQAARRMAEELGLERTVSPYDKDRDGPRPERGVESWEMFRGQRSGLDAREIKAEVTAIFRESQSPADFVHGLQQHGYELAKGDRRDYCIVDPAGDDHSLARRLSGVTTKELREFMKGFDRDSLLTVEQARVFQRQQLHEHHLADLATVQKEIAWEEALAKAAIEKEQAASPTIDPPSAATASRHEGRSDKAIMPENLKGDRARIWEAYNNSDNPLQFTTTLDKDNIRLASVTKDEADRSQRIAEFAGVMKNVAPRYRHGEIVAISERGQIYKLNGASTGADKPKIDKFLQPLDRSTLLGVDKTKEFLKGRADDRIRDVQAFRDLLRDAKQNERMEQARQINQDAITSRTKNHNGVRPVEEAAYRVGARVLGGAFAAAEKIGGAFIGLFDPIQTPVQRYEGQVSKGEREVAAQEQVDISQFTTVKIMEQQLEQAQDPGGRERD